MARFTTQRELKLNQGNLGKRVISQVKNLATHSRMPRNKIWIRRLGKRLSAIPTNIVQKNRERI